MIKVSYTVRYYEHIFVNYIYISKTSEKMSLKELNRIKIEYSWTEETNKQKVKHFV